MAVTFWILIFYTEQSDSDDWSDDYDSDNSWDVSFDGGEQDSNSEGANDEDETTDILDDFDGGEINIHSPVKMKIGSLQLLHADAAAE